MHVPFDIELGKVKKMAESQEGRHCEISLLPLLLSPRTYWTKFDLHTLTALHTVVPIKAIARWVNGTLLCGTKFWGSSWSLAAPPGPREAGEQPWTLRFLLDRVFWPYGFGTLPLLMTTTRAVIIPLLDPNPAIPIPSFYRNYNSSRAVITPVPDPNPAIPNPGFYRNYNSSNT